MREQTLLTPEGVAEGRSYLDWDTQPSLFKHYPHFCYRVALADHPSLEWLSHVRTITDERTVAHKPYRRLNVPSAGNLHPIEIYVQIRNITGILSGIYHLDTLHRELVMIAELGGDGIEPYVGLDHRFSGVIVLLSLIPFRSGWKYGLRSWRYLYLDLGHQIAALDSSVRHFGHHLTKMSPKEGLNRLLGFGDEEFLGAVYGIGEETARSVRALNGALMKVQPTDYSQTTEELTNALISHVPYVSLPVTPQNGNYTELNATRRSAREFNPDGMEDTHIRRLMEIAFPESLEIVPVVLRAHSMQRGVYRNGVCALEGDFVSEILHLLLQQRFIAGANMVVLIFAEEFCAASHIEAGIYAHNLYMACEAYTLGCSGIGAFYDNEALQWSNKPLLYAVAIGGKA